MSNHARTPADQLQVEWARVERVLGTALLAQLVDVPRRSVRRYLAGAQATPDAVAMRLHVLACIVRDLGGSYSDTGVRQWFTRVRTQLDGQPPAALLEGAWDPQDPGPTRARELAASLSANWPP